MAADDRGPAGPAHADDEPLVLDDKAYRLGPGRLVAGLTTDGSFLPHRVFSLWFGRARFAPAIPGRFTQNNHKIFVLEPPIGSREQRKLRSNHGIAWDGRLVELV